ncbi:MAG TPA: VCBS repeat-containing protein, partial [Thermoanaerobaculia bacterium]|nr:VCBS repeat-containing protein [Thermoanaerobaculia bacterium]
MRRVVLLLAALLLVALAGVPAPGQPCAVPGFLPPVRIADTDPDVKPEIFVGDFDGDRLPDILLWSPARAALLHGNGDGSFVEGPSPLPAGLRPRSATDIDGDGWTDFLAEGPDSFVELLGDKRGGFRTGLTWAKPEGLVAVGDVLDADADGERKLLAAVGATLLLLEPEGRPPRNLVTLTVPGTTVSPRILRLIDVNGDGVPDVVASVDLLIYGGGILALRGTSTGTFGPPDFLAGAHYGAPDFRIADLDGDGSLEIVALPVTRVGAVLEIFRQGATGFEMSSFLGPGGPGGFLALADLDADGRTDVVTSTVGHLAAAYLGDGDGSFTNAWLPSPAGIRPYGYNDALAAVSDLNGNSRADLVLLSPDGLFVQLDDCAGGRRSRKLVPPDLPLVPPVPGPTSDARSRLPAAGTAAVRYGPRASRSRRASASIGSSRSASATKRRASAGRPRRWYARAVRVSRRGTMGVTDGRSRIVLRNRGESASTSPGGGSPSAAPPGSHGA